ncbi:MAG: beta-lactamase family protein [Clostridia bacterium]|nr:beta-lactamase family protein [Clostridia bacterium]
MQQSLDFSRSVRILQKGLEAEAYPCIAYAIGCGDVLLDSGYMGNRQVYPTPLPLERDTLFDLASLSKLVSTTMVALRMIERGELELSDTLSRYFEIPADAPAGRGDVTVRHLMHHNSGLTPHLPLWTQTDDPAQAVDMILRSKPWCEPGEQVHYSCMGYILLQKILEKVGEAPLDELARREVFEPLGMYATCYNPTTKNVVTTEFSTLHGEYLCGRVHDENASFMGGVSGNASVFSTLDDMILFARMIASGGKCDSGLYLSPRTFEKAIYNATPGKNENRGLGFQLTPAFSTLTGSLFSEGSYGHTGFTGTALYVDKDSRLWAMILTNAVHFGRNKTELFRTRRLFFNSLADTYFRAQ